MLATEMLLAELRSQRSHVLSTLDGLDGRRLETPVPPATWPPIAAVHHLALDVERWWFQAIVSGDPRAWAYFDAHPNGAWAVPDGTDVFLLYQAECAVSDEIIAAADLGAMPAKWPDFLGPAKTIGEIVLHVVVETATHAGQLDIVREALDGHQYLVLD